MRRKHRKQQVEGELDITAFMNLMIVLVPVLLLNMVFQHTKVLQLNFPTGDVDLSQEELKDEQLQLVVRTDVLEVTGSKAGMIDSIPNTQDGYDFKSLSETLQGIKSRVPEKTDISILLEPNIPYQALVTAMDTTRSYEAVVVTDVVDAELFPDISIGDAPLNSSKVDSIN